MDVAKSELEIYKSKHEAALTQLKEAKDNLERALETRAQRKRYNALIYIQGYGAKKIILTASPLGKLWLECTVLTQALQ